MTKFAKFCLGIGVLLGVAFVAHTYYARSENERLLQIVENAFPSAQVPAGSVLIYEEMRVNRECKIASVKKLYSSHQPPEEACSSLLPNLKVSEWDLKPALCESRTIPAQRVSWHQDVPPLPAYSIARLYGSRFHPYSSRSHVRVQSTFYPTVARLDYYDLGHAGLDVAIPLVKKDGTNFFIMETDYIEGAGNWENCGENSTQCTCYNNHSLWAWKLKDGRSYSRSH